MTFIVLILIFIVLFFCGFAMYWDVFNENCPNHSDIADKYACDTCNPKHKSTVFADHETACDCIACNKVRYINSNKSELETLQARFEAGHNGTLFRPLFDKDGWFDNQFKNPEAEKLEKKLERPILPEHMNPNTSIKLK